MLPYQNPQLDMEARLDDLISRMTLEELILQTDQYASHDIDVGPGDKAPRVFTMEKMEEVFQGRSVGSFGAWGTSPAQTNQIQRYAVEHTRLGIPVMFVEEGLHGASSNGCTIFPQQMGIAASFDPSLSRKMGHAIATAARALGASKGRIIKKHLLTNCIGTLIVTTTLQIPSAIFTESYLSFLGLGVAAPMPSLGSLATDAVKGMMTYPHLLLLPAIIISVVILAFNLFGDGLRDAFDPKLKN